MTRTHVRAFLSLPVWHQYKLLREAGFAVPATGDRPTAQIVREGTDEQRLALGPIIEALARSRAVPEPADHETPMDEIRARHTSGHYPPGESPIDDNAALLAEVERQAEQIKRWNALLGDVGEDGRLRSERFIELAEPVLQWMSEFAAHEKGKEARAALAELETP